MQSDLSVTAPDTVPAGRPRTLALVLAIFILGFAIRIFVAIFFWGSEDVTVQIYHAWRIREGHSAWTSKLPIAYYAPRLALEIALQTRFPEHASHKLPAILGDMLVAVLLLRIATRRGSPRRWLWPAVYLLNPATVTLSAYHGNIDPLMAAAMLWALDLRWREKPIAAGASLGLALAMKPTAILQLPALMIPLRAKGNIRLALAALGVLAAICLPFLLTDPEFGRFLTGYGGAYGEWGITLLMRNLDQNLASRLAFLPGGVAGMLHTANTMLEQHGRYLLAAVLAAWFLYALRRWRSLDFEENARVIAATYLVFFVFATGFGPQYLSLVIPFLIIASLRLSVFYLAVLSPYLIVTYMFSWAFKKYEGQRVFDRLGTLPKSDVFLLLANRGLTVVAWAAGAWVLWRLLRQKNAGTQPEELRPRGSR
ncbi:MAG TPA: glycosyltransferase 87 family protein [Thermoanaerobaculia bacterium]|nr:glycosyltransferase 87 family protein [Thermoanaerobaculia bacterium]